MSKRNAEPKAKLTVKPAVSVAGNTAAERGRGTRGTSQPYGKRESYSEPSGFSLKHLCFFPLIRLFLIKTQVRSLTVMEILRKFPELYELPQPILHSLEPNLTLLVTQHFEFFFPSLQKKQSHGFIAFS